MLSFGPVSIPVGGSYTHVESVNVCDLTSVTVAFSVMGDGGDCADEETLTYTFLPLTPAPTGSPTQLQLQ